MPRRRLRTSVSLEVMIEYASGRREAKVCDISTLGCYVDSAATVRERENISLTLKLPDELPLPVRGEVVYVFAGTGFGVRFLDLGHHEINLLEHLILMNHGDPWAGDLKVV